MHNGSDLQWRLIATGLISEHKNNIWKWKSHELPEDRRKKNRIKHKKGEIAMS